jgi:hypothetical protein
MRFEVLIQRCKPALSWLELPACATMWQVVMEALTLAIAIKAIGMVALIKVMIFRSYPEYRDGPLPGGRHRRRHGTCLGSFAQAEKWATANRGLLASNDSHGGTVGKGLCAVSG